MSNLTDEQKEILEKQKEQCPFCKIVKGEIPAKIVYQDDIVLAILDINPATKGHVLVMPKEHYPIMPIIPPNEFKHLVKRSKELAECLKKALLVEYVNMFIANGGAAGQQSSHFMMHLIPRESGDGINNFDLPNGNVSEEDLNSILEPLKENLKIMMQNHLVREGKVKTEPLSKEQIISLVNKNPQIKDLLLNKTEEFKKAVPLNPQLQQIFGGIDIDALVSELKPSEKKLSKIEILQKLVENNPNLIDRIKKDPLEVLEMIKNSEKYGEDLADLTVEDLNRLIPTEDKKDFSLDDLAGVL